MSDPQPAPGEASDAVADLVAELEGAERWSRRWWRQAAIGPLLGVFIVLKRLPDSPTGSLTEWPAAVVTWAWLAAGLACGVVVVAYSLASLATIRKDVRAIVDPIRDRTASQAPPGHPHHLHQVVLELDWMIWKTIHKPQADTAWWVLFLGPPLMVWIQHRQGDHWQVWLTLLGSLTVIAAGKLAWYVPNLRRWTAQPARPRDP